MKGRRIHEDEKHVLPLEPGDYGVWRGRWMVRTPNGHLGNISGHDITEHEDGTITVSPSILVDAGVMGGWHGFLEKGVWREC